MKTNWDHLRYFNALATNNTLSEAARQLGVSHSTVQRHIAAFEDELQVQLFISASTGYKLTPAGETLFAETADIQRTLTSLSSRLTGSDNQLQGNVSVTAADTISFFLLPPILYQLRRQYPQITVSLNVLNRQTDLHNLEADIAIRSCPAPPADLIGREIGNISLTICAARRYLSAHGLTAENALSQAQDFIALNDSFDQPFFRNWLPAHYSRCRQVKVNGLLSAWRLCNAGMGIALLPEYLLAHDDTLVACASDQPVTGNTLWVLSHAELRDSSRVKVVRQHLIEQLGTVFGR